MGSRTSSFQVYGFQAVGTEAVGTVPLESSLVTVSVTWAHPLPTLGLYGG